MKPNKYTAYLKNKGFRMTKARSGILEVLLATDSPITAFKILVGLEKRKIKADRATVYRTIEWLQQHKIIKQVYLSGSIRYYELAEPTAGHHHHLVCTKCRQTFDFVPTPELERAVKWQTRSAARHHRFKVTDHSFELLGTCTRCSER